MPYQIVIKTFIKGNLFLKVSPIINSDMKNGFKTSIMIIEHLNADTDDMWIKRKYNMHL